MMFPCFIMIKMVAQMMAKQHIFIKMYWKEILMQLPLQKSLFFSLATAKIHIINVIGLWVKFKMVFKMAAKSRILIKKHSSGIQNNCYWKAWFIEKWSWVSKPTFRNLNCQGACFQDPKPCPTWLMPTSISLNQHKIF